MISGIEFRGGLKIHDPQVTEKDPEALLHCLSSYYTIYIDSLPMTGQTYYFAKHPAHGQPGLQTVLDLKQIPAGHHQLRIFCKEKGKEVPYTMIPFWKTADGRMVLNSTPQ